MQVRIEIKPIVRIAFIQGLMHTGIMRESYAKDLLARISGLETGEMYPRGFEYQNSLTGSIPH